MNNEPGISMRPVTPDDREFLLSVYAASREAEFEKYPLGTHDILLVDGVPCGRLYVDRGESEIAILDIIVLPEFQRRGIGTTVVEGLKAEAGKRSVRVYIEKFNPSQKLFSELGFKPETTDADAIHILFRWQNAGGQ